MALPEVFRAVAKRMAVSPSKAFRPVGTRRYGIGTNRSLWGMFHGLRIHEFLLELANSPWRFHCDFVFEFKLGNLLWSTFGSNLPPTYRYFSLGI